MKERATSLWLHSWALGLILLTHSASAASRNFIIKNECSFTIWPVMTNFQTSAYTGPRGWEAPVGSSITRQVPSPANIRVWARRDCTFDASGTGKCVSGDCSGKLECGDTDEGWCNWVEINVDGGMNMDWWDMSYVPGFNLQMQVQPSGGCQGVTCTKDLNPTCPDSSMKDINSSGETVGCLSACMARIRNGTQIANDVACCSGTLQERTACTAQFKKFPYYDFFHDGCPQAYVFPYDDNTGAGWPTVVYTCDTSKNADFTITFCPGGSESTVPTSSSSSRSSSAVGTKSSTTSTSKPALSTSQKATNSNPDPIQATTTKVASGKTTTSPLRPADSSATTHSSSSQAATQLTEASQSNPDTNSAIKSNTGDTNPLTATNSLLGDGEISATDSVAGVATQTTNTAALATATGTQSQTPNSSDSVLGLPRSTFYLLVGIIIILVVVVVAGIACFSAHKKADEIHATGAGESTETSSETDSSDSDTSGDDEKREKSMGKSSARSDSDDEQTPLRRQEGESWV